jgi:3-methyl-2-oxobutanoate hydroxymethyltransferase
MGHIGLTPQSVNQMSGYRVQGRDPEDAKSLIEDALALQDAGVYSLVLETVPTDLAKEITEQVSIPTVGIGAGVHCDGQVLVFHDVFGLNTGRKKKHVRQYANLAEVIIKATIEYMADIQSEEFPDDEESFSTSRKVAEETAVTTAAS